VYPTRWRDIPASDEKVDALLFNCLQGASPIANLTDVVEA